MQIATNIIKIDIWLVKFWIWGIRISKGILVVAGNSMIGEGLPEFQEARLWHANNFD